MLQMLEKYGDAMPFDPSNANHSDLYTLTSPILLYTNA